MLLSADCLKTVNIVLQRKEQEQAEVNLATIMNTPRGGCAGAGILIEMPLASCNANNTDEAPLDWIFPVVVIENPQLNYASPTADWSAKGTFVDAERWLQMVKDVVHNHADERYGTFKVDADAVKFTNEWPGMIAYRMPFMLPKAKSIATQRVGQIQGSIVAGTCTLACAADSDARIFYTLDGSYPTNENGQNPNSRRYTAPFAVQAAVPCVRAVGYKVGKNQSAAKFLLNS